MSTKPPAKRRGSQLSPHNRYLAVERVDDFEHLEHDQELRDEQRIEPTQFLPDQSRSVISENQSPDISFRFSLNPYRGCEHGCSYCYARPTHEYLGLNAGLDFETRVFVKHHAPAQFREWLNRPAWTPDVVCFSGVTDCYQPAERKYRLTRACLEVAWEAKQPISIITKNALVCRDLDLLSEMASEQLVNVSVSLTTLDVELAKTMEPRTSLPARRLEAIERLSSAGIPVRVMTAPVIPGLNDSEIPELLKQAASAGAVSAAYVLLRLPLTVKPVFLDWLQSQYPSRAERVISLIQHVRGGRMNDATFRGRMRGVGQIASQIEESFRVFSRKYDLHRSLPPQDFSKFQPPQVKNGQLRLF